MIPLYGYFSDPIKNQDCSDLTSIVVECQRRRTVPEYGGIQNHQILSRISNERDEEIQNLYVLSVPTTKYPLTMGAIHGKRMRGAPEELQAGLPV